MRIIMIAALALAITGCASNVVTDYNPATVFWQLQQLGLCQQRPGLWFHLAG